MKTLTIKVDFNENLNLAETITALSGLSCMCEYNIEESSIYIVLPDGADFNGIIEIVEQRCGNIKKIKLDDIPNFKLINDINFDNIEFEGPKAKQVLIQMYGLLYDNLLRDRDAILSITEALKSLSTIEQESKEEAVKPAQDEVAKPIQEQNTQSSVKKTQIYGYDVEAALSNILNDDLRGLTLTKDRSIEEQLPYFLRKVGLDDSPTMVKAFIASLGLTKINYEGVINKIAINSFEAFEVKDYLKRAFKAWIKKYPEITKKHPKVCIIAVFRVFSKHIKSLENVRAAEYVKALEEPKNAKKTATDNSGNKASTGKKVAEIHNFDDKPKVSQEEALLNIIKPALYKLTSKEKIKSFLDEIGMCSDEMMQSAFEAACVVKRIKYDTIIIELNKKFPRVSDRAIKAKLQIEFKKWLRDCEEFPEECNRLEVIALFKLVAKKLGNLR